MALLILVDVVYHVIIVGIGHGLLKKFWTMVIGNRLRSTHYYADPLERDDSVAGPTWAG